MEADRTWPLPWSSSHSCFSISGLVSAFGMLTLMKQRQHVCGWHKMVPRPVATLTRFPGKVAVKVTGMVGGPWCFLAQEHLTGQGSIPVNWWSNTQFFQVQWGGLREDAWGFPELLVWKGSWDRFSWPWFHLWKLKSLRLAGRRQNVNITASTYLLSAENIRRCFWRRSFHIPWPFRCHLANTHGRSTRTMVTCHRMT